jgi:hypothetical protein
VTLQHELTELRERSQRYHGEWAQVNFEKFAQSYIKASNSERQKLRKSLLPEA